jgi:arylsulfatase A-like enzyme
MTRAIASFGWLPLVGLLLVSAAGAADQRAGRRPNVVLIVADDLGYGELGCFGQRRIRTPHLDRLAAEGMRLTQHTSGNAVCAASRAVLMTGLHPGHAFIRNNRPVKPEGQYPISADTITLAKLLKQEGYATGAFGKWGLGPPASEGDPLKQGFDRFFGYNCQAVAHNYYPTYLWDNERRVALDNAPFSAHQKLPAGSDPDDRQSYVQYAGRDYAPDRIAEQALRFARENRERPFFLYFPTIVPHLALQVPDDSLAEYRGAFEETPYDGGKGYLPQRTPRAAYAAMITRMDREVGRIVELVKSLGLDGDTIFIFSSDNGPAYDNMEGTDSDFFASAGPLRGRKGSLYEGGTRVPTIVRWTGHVAAGSESQRVTGFEDWLPTILELTGAGQAVPKGLDGISFAPTLMGKSQPERPFLYREFPDYGGQQSVRMGPWKGVRQNLLPKKPGTPNMHIELYHLIDDVGETKDISAEHADVGVRIEAIMRAEHVASVQFPFPALDELGKN